MWLLAFYDQAELHALALSATLSPGDYPTAEYHAHRCLAGLRLTTTRLAHAQHVRVSATLQEFGAALRAVAPGKSTVEAWAEHTASWRTNA